LILLVSFLVISSSWPTDVPFWPKYPTRKVQVLDGEWAFGFSDKVDPLSVDPKNIQTPDKINVPSAFDVEQPGVLGRRGTAFYRTTVSIDPTSDVLLYFTACSFYCSVFVDDVWVGDHRAGGYQPFWFSAKKNTKSVREIFVVVDNRWNATTAPTTTGGDFYFYGGITRSVLVHQQPAPTYIHQVETFTVDYNGIINVRVVLGGQSVSSVSLSLSWDGSPPDTPAQVPVTDGVATLSKIKVPNAKPWSLTSPNLHTLLVNLHEGSSIVDAIQVRFGLRVVSIANYKSAARLAINGEVVKLTGINRHTMWPDTGSALTLEQVKTDVKLLQNLGANYVRGAHYPQDPRFLDLCDEVGIAVWEETLGPGVKTSDLLNAYFMKYQIQAVNEMISASINHPSVILHAFYNEGPSNDPKACPGYNASAQAIRNRVGNPPTRFVTWANDHTTGDVCLNIADVISFNSYPGWYDHQGDLNSIEPFWKSQADWVHTHYPQKPFLISETGAGGIYEWDNKTDPYWSQLYQSEVVERSAQFAATYDSVSGITIWQFADIKADDSDTKKCGSCQYYPHPPSLSVAWNCSYIDVKCGRPGGENHKGAVDFWRREKIDYVTLQKNL